MREPAAQESPLHAQQEQRKQDSAYSRMIGLSFTRGKRRHLFASAAAILVLLAAVLLSQDSRAPEIWPLKASRLSQLQQFHGSYRDKMLWGTYRPGLYFGMRMRQPEGLQTGLMWFDPDRPAALQNIRHQAQERDGLSKFGWERHDGRSFGRQELYDGSRRITTSFAKRFCEGCRGGDWAVRLTMRDISEAATGDQTEVDGEPRGSLIFYIANNHGSGSGHQGSVSLQVEEEDSRGVLLASGTTHPLAGWQLHAASSQGEQLPRIHYLGVQSQHVHNLSELVAARMANPSLLAVGGRRSRMQTFGGRPNTLLPDEVDVDPNVALFQVSGFLPLSVDLTFTGSLTAPQEKGWMAGGASGMPRLLTWHRTPTERPWPAVRQPPESMQQRVHALSGSQLTRRLQDGEQRFEERFASTFGDLDVAGTPNGTDEACKAALSNMLGGIGYFYGSSAVRVGTRIAQSWPAALFTAVPSRSFFPRGFLWDEGFHQLLIRKWDPLLSRDILAHWLDLLNSQGWIAREQILGEEARSRVPAEFIVQDPNAANPPTLFLPLADMARHLAGGQSQDPAEAEFLRAAYPRMRTWLDWFIRTQHGQLPGSWRWRGRHMEHLPDPLTGQPTSFTRELNPKTLSSGLDDYPRASHPSGEERHLDLYCWMALAASSLATIGKSLKLPGRQVAQYEQLAAQLSDVRHLNAMHYDHSVGQYRDWGNHTEHVRLDWRYIELPKEWQQVHGAGRRRHDMVRIADSPPQLQFVPHYGYVSLFPVLMRLLEPDSQELRAQLQHLTEERILTPFGLRSLSLGSSLHGRRNTEHDPPYWRGHVWININFLALASLKHYSQVVGPHAETAKKLHDTLRAGLLNLTVGGYHESGYFWENYEEEEGAGRGCRPFTGWTALTVLIAGETYFDL